MLALTKRTVKTPRQLLFRLAALGSSVKRGNSALSLRAELRLQFLALVGYATLARRREQTVQSANHGRAGIK